MTVENTLPKLTELAADFGDVHRDAIFECTGFAGGAGPQLLCCAVTPRLLQRAISQSSTAAVVVPPSLAREVPETLGLLVASDAEIAFWHIHNLFVQNQLVYPVCEQDVHSDVIIDSSAIVEPGVRIGAGVHIAAGAIVKSGTTLESGVRIDEGAIIGGEGLFVRRRPGQMLRIIHAGGVRIGRDCWIMSGAQVSRAVFAGETHLGARVALGPGVNVGHSVSVGEGTSVAGRASIAGFARVGADVWIGPGAVISSEIVIGDGARVELGAVVGVSVPEKERWSGFFARPHRVMMRIGAVLARENG